MPPADTVTRASAPRRPERLRLRDSVRLDVVYRDTTRHGSAVTGRCDEVIRLRCPTVAALRKLAGMKAVIVQARKLLTEAMDGGGLGEFYQRPGVLKDDVLYPPSTKVRPIGLRFEDNDTRAVHTITLPPAAIGDLADRLHDLSAGGPLPRTSTARRLWQELEAFGALEPVPSGKSRTSLDGEVIFVGHATAIVQAAGNRLAVDPFFQARAHRYPSRYQPITGRELGHLDAVFITHGHCDHFDLPSLAALGADTPIYVPTVERESILSVDLATRLEELGFRRVRRMAWGDTVTVGPFVVRALPFYGEQPTTGERYHADQRNQGNLYVVESGGRRHVFTVDAGSDASGDTRQVASDDRRRRGPAETVFGTHRGFAVYPINYLFSSVARYLLFVPRWAWTMRQRIMNDADDLIDVAEAWDARTVVPYACGGAPWFWEMGLGPRLDGHRHDAETDPPPDELVWTAARRSGPGKAPFPSATRPMVLRPGDALSYRGEKPQVRRLPGHHWPYGTRL